MKKNIFLGLLHISLLAGCAENSVETNTLPKEAATINTISTELEGKEWKLVGFEDSHMPFSGKATLFLKNGRYSGSTGCNAMSGTYLLEGNKLILNAGISTMMACSNMALETKYNEAMRKVNRYKMEENRLILLYGDYQVLNFIGK